MDITDNSVLECNLHSVFGQTGHHSKLPFNFKYLLISLINQHPLFLLVVIVPRSLKDRVDLPTMKSMLSPNWRLPDMWQVALSLSLSLSLYSIVSHTYSGSIGKPPKPSRSSIEETAAATSQAAATGTEEPGEEEVFPPPSSPPGVSCHVSSNNNNIHVATQQFSFCMYS